MSSLTGRFNVQDSNCTAVLCSLSPSVLSLPSSFEAWVSLSGSDPLNTGLTDISGQSQTGPAPGGQLVTALHKGVRVHATFPPACAGSSPRAELGQCDAWLQAVCGALEGSETGG